MEARPAHIDVLLADHKQFSAAECRQKKEKNLFFILIDAAGRVGAPCVIEFFGRLRVVVFGGLAYQQNAPDRPSSKETLLPSNLLSLAKVLTAGKTRVLILQTVHPWPVKAELIQSFSSRKAPHSRGAAVYLTVLHVPCSTSRGPFIINWLYIAFSLHP